MLDSTNALVASEVPSSIQQLDYTLEISEDYKVIVNIPYIF